MSLILCLVSSIGPVVHLYNTSNHTQTVISRQGVVQWCCIVSIIMPKLYSWFHVACDIDDVTIRSDQFPSKKHIVALIVLHTACCMQLPSNNPKQW